MQKKQNLSKFLKNYKTFYPKKGQQALKLWVWNPGSGKNLYWIRNPGVKMAPDPGSGSATLDNFIFTLFEMLNWKEIWRSKIFKNYCNSKEKNMPKSRTAAFCMDAFQLKKLCWYFDSRAFFDFSRITIRPEKIKHKAINKRIVGDLKKFILCRYRRIRIRQNPYLILPVPELIKL
jgi:hypothetical protein